MLKFQRLIVLNQTSDQTLPETAMANPPELPEDLAQFRSTYEALFGVVPPLPEGSFAFTSDVDAEFLRLAERLRAHAFYSSVFDAKTTQLMLFGLDHESLLEASSRITHRI
jgi:hypothetical protein